MDTHKVYEAICNIAADLGKIGIAKDRKNQQQGYAFRGIDDVYCALSSMLAKHRLCILPRVIDSNTIERQTKQGGLLFNTTVKMEFDLVSSEDGSKHTVATIGEAMDSGDKSSNKAQSAAYKYMAFQTFCIPTEGDNDADAHTHDIVPAQSQEQQDETDLLLDAAADAAGNGTPAYEKFWRGLTSKQQRLIGEKRHADFWALAEEH